MASQVSVARGGARALDGAHRKGDHARMLYYNGRIGLRRSALITVAVNTALATIWLAIHLAS